MDYDKERVKFEKEKEKGGLCCQEPSEKYLPVRL